MEEKWDVIVVGARCAGSVLATLLAKKGVRTLVVEASPRGTDMPMSTHLVQSPGMDVLDRIGVGDRVRAAAPPTKTVRYSLDDSVLVTAVLPGRNPYCIRRSMIDPWLQDAAEASGAELLDRHKVVDLVRDGERVTGVVVRGPSSERTLRAGLVVGADGMHSTVAKLARAEEYLVLDGTRGGYFGYFPAPPKWENEWDAAIEYLGKEMRYVFRCDSGLVALVYVGSTEEVSAWGADYRSKLKEVLLRSPVTGPLAEGKEPVGKVIGLLKSRFFYRKPIGPGFALVGDAGHFKDFVTGQGMADAFLDAERLSDAILDGRPEAFERYWRERDVATLPLHFDALQQGHIDYNDPFMRWVIAGVAKNEALGGRLAYVLDRKVQPQDMIPGKAMLRLMGAALLRGRFDVISGFLRVGKTMSTEARELAERKKLLDEADRRLAAAPAAARERRAVAA
jgi:2-polyprenyl-6-methoxyphenol hydroxylase-like FAD-dependent oxidoreductase